MRNTVMRRSWSSVCIALTLLALASLVGSQEPTAPVVVKFHEPKMDVTESSAPTDPTVRVVIQNAFGMAFGLNADGARLTFSSGSIRTTFKVDNQIVVPNV